jgi:hypothetical protein
MRHTALWSCTHIPNKYYLKNNYLTLRSKVNARWRSFRYVTHRLMVMHPHTKYHWPISKDKNVMSLTRKYYLKNNYLTLRSKVKVPQSSLWYATQPYGHAPTYQISLTYLERQKCYGPDKKILFKKQLFDLEVKGQGPTKIITVCDTPPFGHAPTYQI